MSGFRLFFFILNILFLSCIKNTKNSNKEGDALFSLYKTDYVDPKTIAFWKNSESYLLHSLPADRFFIENLNADYAIFQINKTVALDRVFFGAKGKAIEIDFVSVPSEGNVRNVRGHLIFVRKEDVENYLLTIDGQPVFYTNVRDL